MNLKNILQGTAIVGFYALVGEVCSCFYNSDVLHWTAADTIGVGVGGLVGLLTAIQASKEPINSNDSSYENDLNDMYRYP